MKSHCHAIDIGNGILHLCGRYNWEEDVSVDDYSYEGFLRHIVKECSCGRTFYSGCWSNVLQKYGIVVGE